MTSPSSTFSKIRVGAEVVCEVDSMARDDVEGKQMRALIRTTSQTSVKMDLRYPGGNNQGAEELMAGQLGS